MDNAVDFFEALLFGFPVSTFLLPCAESRGLIQGMFDSPKPKSSAKMKLNWLQLTVEIKEQIHYELFQGYCLINDYSRAIEYGREVLV